MSTNLQNKPRVLVLNGPNLNLLGTREPGVYGHQTLADINQQLSQLAEQHGLSLSCLQSNAEHELIDAIHAARDTTDYIVINPAALSHTSIALRDALLGVGLPCYEVHLSNIYRREAFRHHSYIADIAEATLSGFGSYGYSLALLAISERTQTSN